MIGIQEQQQQQPKVVERLNPAVQQQLNLDSVKTRAISLFKAISRILEDFDAIARTNSAPKWHDILGQFSMVNLELFNIVEDIKNVSKAFIVHPKNVNAENASILPVMLSSKLLPEMEMDDNSKREQLLLGMQGLPIASQIDKLKGRVDAIAAACESAEKIIADTRKTYFGTRQGPNLLPAVDKAQAAKIQEQETSLRSAVNHGEGLRLPSEQRHMTSTLPAHLADILSSGDGGVYSFTEPSGLYQKSTPLNGNSNTPQLQAPGAQVIGRAAASPSTALGNNFDNTTASSMQYAISPKSGSNIVNIPSPQQQSNQQLQRQLQQKKIMQLPLHQQQLLNNPQLRPSSVPLLGQNQLSQLPDISTQAQQKFQQMHGQQHMQYSQSLAAQQGRQLVSAPMHMGQTQLTQGSQLNRQLNQFSSAANNALYNAAQTTPGSQMIPNISAMMPSQTVMPRMQLGMVGVNRTTLPSQNLSDQIYNIGSSNAGGMMPQVAQHGNPGSFVSQGAQNIQASMQQNAAVQNHPNFQQQRPRNQQ